MIGLYGTELQIKRWGFEDIEKKFMVTKGERGGERDKLGAWD